MEKEKAEKIWNYLCVHINKNRNSLEEELQKNIEFLFAELGWSKLNGEIIHENELPIGSKGKLKLDITIKNNDKNIIVIELKRNNNYNTNKSEPQLFSYIRQSDVKFGILIDGNLQFYYKIPEEKPIKVFEADFSENDEQAAEFISLISKPFEENKLLEFCEKRILKLEDEEPFEELKNEIINGTLDSKAKTSFIKFLQEKYNEQIANKISNEIEIKILLRNSSIRNEKTHNKNFVKEKKRNGKAPHFTFDMVKIEPGTPLVFTKNEKIEGIIVKNRKNVQYKNKEYKLSPLTRILMNKPGKQFDGPQYFKVKGKKETLDEMRKRMENKKQSH